MYKDKPFVWTEKELCETNPPPPPLKYNPWEATVKFCLNMEKKQKKKVHESSSIAGTVWDKRYSKQQKVHVQNLKVRSTFPIVELAEKKGGGGRTKKGRSKVLLSILRWSLWSPKTPLRRKKNRSIRRRWPRTTLKVKRWRRDRTSHRRPLLLNTCRRGDEAAATAVNGGCVLWSPFDRRRPTADRTEQQW